MNCYVHIAYIIYRLRGHVEILILTVCTVLGVSRLFWHCLLYSFSSSPWSNRLERGLPKLKLMRATPVTDWSNPSIRIPSGHHDRQYLLSIHVQKGSFLSDRHQFAE